MLYFIMNQLFAQCFWGARDTSLRSLCGLVQGSKLHSAALNIVNIVGF